MNWLLYTDDWPARQVCGDWPQWLIEVHRTSDIIIGTSYVIIALLLAGVLRTYHSRPNQIPFMRTGVVLTAIFVVGNAMTHFSDYTMFVYPAYRFDGLVKAACAVVSMLTSAWLLAVVASGMTGSRSA